MKLTTTLYTIAEYCGQMSRDEIIVNHEYQRSQRVWPPAARSYLIDTILLGYPVPKLTLYQRTDLLSRQTTKEVVDGQQRSQAILSFLNGKMRLSSRSPNAGRTFAKLDERDQHNFLEYNLAADVVSGVTDVEIRDIFRRINSYTVPLNDAEKRHAVFQGEFKWFVVDLTEAYAGTLKRIGVFGERQLTRMADAQLFAEIVRAMISGIATSQPEDMEELYKRHEDAFPEMDDVRARIDAVLDRLVGWPDLHSGPLMRPYNFYSLFLAIAHLQNPLPSLTTAYALEQSRDVNDPGFLANLAVLADALDEPENYPDLEEFVNAASQATNVAGKRLIRFEWFCTASEATLLR
jgi:hypothetical protein